MVPLWYRLVRPICPDRRRPGTMWTLQTLTDASAHESTRLGAERSLVQIQSPRLQDLRARMRARKYRCATRACARSLPPEPEKTLVEPEQPCNRIRLGIRDFDVGNRPVGKCGLYLPLARSRGSGPRRPGANTSSNTVASSAAIAVTSLPIAAPWSAFRPWKVPVSSTSRNPVPTPASEIGYVALNHPHFDVGLPHPLASAVEGFNQVDSRHLPAALRQLDPPDRAAAAEIECRPVGRLASALLTPERVGELAGERRMLGKVLPGMNPRR